MPRWISTIAYWYVAKYRKREYHVKSIEYRNIAEIMRVKYYWSVAGVLCPISDIFSEYRRNPTETTRNVLKGWAHTLHPSDKLDVPDDEKIRLVRDAWVEDQEKYHLKKKMGNRKRISFHEGSERTFQIISIAISVFIVCIGFITDQTSFRIFGLTAVATLLLLNFIMSFTGIIARMESTILASHIYGGSPDEIGMKENMFRVAKIRMDRLVPDSGVMDGRSVEASKKILYELGMMSIEECNEWAATHMSMDIGPPVPRNE